METQLAPTVSDAPYASCVELTPTAWRVWLP